MKYINVWDLKKDMFLFEDNSMVSEAGYIRVLEDAKQDENQTDYFTAPVRRNDGYEYTVGASKDYPAYTPILYLIKEKG